jgi:type IV pilus assembly protein PilY1
MGRTIRNIFVVIIWLVITNSPGGVKSAYADEADIFLANLKPNVFIILDNSNSFDEDFLGNPVCSWATGSRSVEGRRQLLNVVNANANNMRIGLMSFHLNTAVCVNGDNPIGVCPAYLSNAPYFVSYNDNSWCPTPPAPAVPGGDDDCVTYCKTGVAANKNACNTACQAGNGNFDADYTLSNVTGEDAVFTTYGYGNANRNKYCNLIYPKTNRIPNPTNAGKYIQYKLPGQNYYYLNEGTAFCYAHANYTVDAPGTSIWDCNSSKTTTSDGWAGYGGHINNYHYTPTDDDLALGFTDFGIRNVTLYSGQTWIAMSSPGGGYLQVATADNPTNNSQLNALTAKLAMHENDQTGYMSCAAADRNTCSYIINAGNTPTEGVFRSAINYFKGENDYQSGTANTSPIQAWCQKNFIIFVTDGLPSTNPSGGNDSATNLLPGVLTQITNLSNNTLTTAAVPGYTFAIPTYVLGMALTDQSKPLLDQMAVAGGTQDVNGHAYYADNPTQLAAALAAIPQDIITRTYSFATSSVASSRITDENFLYEASFIPINSDPFWRGYLKQYNINADGTLGSVNWEAGAILAGQDFSLRTIKTSNNGGLIDFTTGISRTRFAVADNPTRNAVVGYIQGNPANNPEVGNWKLGDIFHSNPVNVGTPNLFYEDDRDQNYNASYTCNAYGGTAVRANAFDQHRCDHLRSSANGLRRIVAGANDGQFHVFSTNNGNEQWSFVPPNLLPQLQYLAHATLPSAQTHQYLVDGPVTVADAWLGTGDGTSKSKADWHTLAIFGEGKGGVNLWSSDSQCDNNFQATADGTYHHYCGYYAFDVTNTAAVPGTFNWHLGGTSAISAANQPYLGQPWSKMMVGRVRYNNGADQEKWVGFIGGGYNGTSCTAGQVCGVDCDCGGKGFYVIDLSNGQILWSYTRNNDANMQYSMPASPVIVDTDLDGFIDTVYVGDLGGNMWRFKFCTSADILAGCGISGQTVNWTGGRLYSSATAQPIFQSASVAVDNQQNFWVYWGTGNKETPKDTATHDTIFAMKDNDRSTTYAIGNLKNVTNCTGAVACYSSADTQDGFYINLSGTGEKMLADPTVFGGVVYITTYTPPTGGGDLCLQGGTASLYALLYTSGNGAFGGSARSMSLGAGIASSPLISMKPGGSTIGDIYITLSGGGGIAASTQRVNFNPPGLSNRVNILNWKDRRIQ